MLGSTIQKELGETDSRQVEIQELTEDNLIDRTIEVWQPRNANRLSDEDARAILENVKGFFTLLLEWETNEQQKKGGGQDESHYAKSA